MGPLYRQYDIYTYSARHTHAWTSVRPSTARPPRRPSNLPCSHQNAFERVCLAAM